MDALTMRAWWWGVLCAAGPSPVPKLPIQPPTHPRRAAPAAIFPVKIFLRKSAKNGSLLLTCPCQGNGHQRDVPISEQRCGLQRFV